MTGPRSAPAGVRRRLRAGQLRPAHEQGDRAESGVAQQAGQQFLAVPALPRWGRSAWLPAGRRTGSRGPPAPAGRACRPGRPARWRSPPPQPAAGNARRPCRAVPPGHFASSPTSPVSRPSASRRSRIARVPSGVRLTRRPGAASRSRNAAARSPLNGRCSRGAPGTPRPGRRRTCRWARRGPRSPWRAPRRHRRSAPGRCRRGPAGRLGQRGEGVHVEVGPDRVPHRLREPGHRNRLLHAVDRGQHVGRDHVVQKPHRRGRLVGLDLSAVLGQVSSATLSLMIGLNYTAGLAFMLIDNKRSARRRTGRRRRHAGVGSPAQAPPEPEPEAEGGTARRGQDTTADATDDSLDA